jgi:adenosylcobinamide kinase/adenosylcobinamide-phosphate guanylyltransferase
MVVLVTGGVRSGKSSFAEQYVRHHFSSAVYVATAFAFDEEMRQRIQMHVDQRRDSGFAWKTIEESYELSNLIKKDLPDEAVILVDCLTVWLSNWLIKLDVEQSIDSLSEIIDELIEVTQSVKGTIVFVTNEVGSGIVPEYKLGRLFRDYAGILNRRLAELADEVIMVVAGIPVPLKQLQYDWKSSRQDGGSA